MRILFIAETASIHAARWINQLKDTGWDIHIFQGIAPGYGVSPDLKFGDLYLPYISKVPSQVNLHLTLSQSSLVQKFRSNSIIEKLLRTRTEVVQDLHVRYLADLIDRIKPDVIHSLGLNINWNNMCLPVLQAKRILGDKFKAPWVYSSWGSDLDFYARQSDTHRAEAKAVLSACDYYIAECERDVRLAKELGFNGEFAGFFPAFGGVPWDSLQKLRHPGPVSHRKTILLKGRDYRMGGDPVGRAMTAMEAFSLCRDLLSDYEIVIGQASSSVVQEAEKLSAYKDLTIKLSPYVEYEEILRILGMSRVFMAMTINDGLPSSLVEAMSLGALPIHSDLEPIREWITDGMNGLLVPAEDPRATACALKRALKDDNLVETAAYINANIIKERLSDKVVRPKVIEMYEEIACRDRMEKPAKGMNDV
jgi:glycosyltransferase involved in cell wall biosynthesis